MLTAAMEVILTIYLGKSKSVFRQSDVCGLLRSGPFDKVYIYDYMRCKIILWTPQGGCVDASEHRLKGGRP